MKYSKLHTAVFIILTVLMTLFAACCTTKQLHTKTTEPISSHTTIVLLDFNGYDARDSSAWHVGHFLPARMNDTVQLTVLNEVDDYYEDWDIFFTRDENLFYGAPLDKRHRVTISQTPVYQGDGLFNYSSVVGIAIYNQYLFQDTTAAYVHDQIWETVGATDKISKVIAHEVGHMIGLKHQSKWTKIFLDAVYNTGDSVEAPLMGHPGKGKKAIWVTGINEAGDKQDDRDILTRILGLRPKPLFSNFPN